MTFGRLSTNCVAADGVLPAAAICGPHLQNRIVLAKGHTLFASTPDNHSRFTCFLLYNFPSCATSCRPVNLSEDGEREWDPLRSRPHSTKSTKTNGKASAVSPNHDEEHDHDHDHNHSHSHSIFGHTHSRDDGPSKEVESVLQVFQGKADRGSRITVIGLMVNVGLTISKFGAGWFMNSAALLAEAGHSASGE